MNKINKRKVYQTPQAVDLSGHGATGQDPMGWCNPGFSPAPPSSYCRSGSSPTQADTCSPVGLGPTIAGCSVGSQAVQLCTVGSIYNAV